MASEAVWGLKLEGFETSRRQLLDLSHLPFSCRKTESVRSLDSFKKACLIKTE